MREGWEYKKFTDVCNVQYGYAFDSKCFTENPNDTPLIRIRDVQRGYSETFYNGPIPEGYLVNEGEYLVGMDGEFNIGQWGKRAGLLNQRVCKMSSCHESLADGYMYYFMKVCLKKIEDETPFVTVKHLSAKRINQIIIPLPPLSTQLTIVSELDKINELIRLKKEQLKDYDNLAQSIFYEMFGDPVENEKGWEVKKLGEFGKVVTGNTPSRKVESYYSENFIEWIKTDNIYDELIFPTPAAEYLSKEGSLVGRKVRKDSVLVACIAGSMSSIGKCCITNREVAFNQQINGIEPYKDIVESKFLYCLINFSKKYIQESATNGMKHILSKSNFEDIQFPLPPLPLQQLFASRITQIEAQKAEVQRAITDLETLLASRMQYWFE